MEEVHMANNLKMAIVHAVIGLLERGWSYRRIARELGVHRETVARYDRLRRERTSKPAIPPPGSGSCEEPKPAISTPGSPTEDLQFLPISDRAVGRRSQCKPFAQVIKAKLEQGLSAQRIWQDLVTEDSYAGSYSSVKRYVHRLGSSTVLPFRRMECAPAHEAQVDFGSGAWVIQDGKRRRPHVLRITLSHSRKSYSEAVWKQTTENFIRCLENAFRSFGGVVATLVVDNLKAAVKNPDWFDPELNPKIVSFAKHYGFVILPTKPYTPRHKGKIESGIKYVKNNALKGRIFQSLSEQNRFLAHWERRIADTRIHGTTKKQVRRVFEEIERPALQPLPTDTFPFYHEGRRKVHRDAHVEVARAYYSVPPEYLGREVWVRWDSRLVRIYNDRFEQITVHGRVEPGRFHTQRSHIEDAKISAVERGVEYLLEKATRIGRDAGCWAQAMIDARGIEGVRVLQGFVHLTSKYPCSVINHASRIAHDGHLFRLRPLRELCKRLSQEEKLEFTSAHPLIRPLSEYQSLFEVSSTTQPKKRR
jgi:transposase